MGKEIEVKVESLGLTFQLRGLTFGQRARATRVSGMKADLNTNKLVGSQEEYYKFMMECLKDCIIEPVEYKSAAVLADLPADVMDHLFAKLNTISHVDPLPSGVSETPSDTSESQKN